MANQRSGSVLYVSATGSSDITQNVYVTRIVLTPTSAGAVLLLKNSLPSPQTKLDLRAATSGESKDLNLTDTPMLFENGITVSTLTNCVATIFTSETGSSS